MMAAIEVLAFLTPPRRRLPDRIDITRHWKC